MVTDDFGCRATVAMPMLSLVTMPENGSCTCTCCCCPLGYTWQRSVKRKLDNVEIKSHGILIQTISSDMPSIDVLARVEIENECSALREALARQQQTIQELYTELEEERNSSSTAANEAMSMILRLQREKAEIQMDARQFKRFAEEKMAHDQEEILTLEDVFYKRDQTVQALSYEVQAYKHRLMSYGISPDSDPTIDIGTPRGMEVNEEENIGGDGGSDTPVYYNSTFDYPPLRCINIPDTDISGINDEIVDFDKYAPGDTPRTPGKHEQLQHIEQCINHMERTFSNSHLNTILEKGVVVGNSPRRPRPSRQFSIDSTSSVVYKDYSGSNRRRCGPASIDQMSDAGRDSMTDRIYTIDAVHGAPKAPTVGLFDDYVSTPRDSVMIGSMGVDDVDIKKLYMRLQALEADRESLKQTIVSMRTDSAQLVLLREIAHNLSKGMTQPMPAPEKRPAKKPSLVVSLSCIALFKWIMSFLLWKKKAGRIKYTFGLSSSNAGLLLAIDRSPSARHRRCLTRKKSSITSQFHLL